MFEFVSDIIAKDDASKKVYEALRELESLQALVGIPEDKSPRKEDKITNAELLYIHTNGSPVNGIPARPVIEPAIKDSKEEISKHIKEASQRALNGDIEGMRNSYEKAGLKGENAARDWFTNPKNNWKDVKQETINHRKKKMSKKQLENAIGNENAHRPLIDTGELRKSITHVVREKD